MSTFGKEFEQIWPCKDFNTNLTKYGLKLLKKCLQETPKNSKEVDLEDFKLKSENFPLEVEFFLSFQKKNNKILSFIVSP